MKSASSSTASSTSTASPRSSRAAVASRFSALVVVGDGNGHVGVGLGKANEVPEAIRKGTEQAKKNLFKIPLVKGTHPARGRSATSAPAQVLLKPARAVPASSPAARCARSLEVGGHPATSSPSASAPSNPHNVIHATVDGAASSCARPSRSPQPRGKNVDEICRRLKAASRRGGSHGAQAQGHAGHAAASAARTTRSRRSRGLGLTRIARRRSSSRTPPSIRGMIRKVAHLVTVEAAERCASPTRCKASPRQVHGG